MVRTVLAMAYLNFMLLKVRTPERNASAAPPLKCTYNVCAPFFPQVNGVDVSSCSHEEAVQVFLSAEEPITVEVKRREPSAVPAGEDVSKRELPGTAERASTASVAVQTEDPDAERNLLLDEDEDVLFDESPVSDQIVNIFDECLVPDVDFEVRPCFHSSSTN